ncbi:type I-E CRISPR-associated protein Cse2/CasB [Sutterella sp.]|uniref:type I-E CRISPR-associated protein Cse2/CasB n=1 Tax=Sutterella sp. TaxID=1981025 RepID=UPI003FD8E99A
METSKKYYLSESAEKFVAKVFKKKETDGEYRSSFRRAISPRQAYKSYSYIAGYFDLRNEVAREACLLIGSSIAWEDALVDGSDEFGKALRKSWNDKSKSVEDVDSVPSVIRLRRLLACRDAVSVCHALRPILQLVRNRVPGKLKYADLLKDILWFDRNPEKIKAKWVMDFYASEDKPQATEDAK